MSAYNDDHDDLVGTAQKRFKLAQDAEAQRRAEMRDDLRFLRLREQWPAYARKGREQFGRPMLVVNRLMQFRNQVVNEIRMNSPSIRVRPVDDNADVKTAAVFEGIIRHIAAISNADAAFDTAAEYQVDCGLGYIQITTDYADDDSWDQEILIKRVPDPSKVWFDPFSTEPDGSDAQWAFLCEEVPRKEFEAQYPDVDTSSWNILSGQNNPVLWIRKDAVTVAQYWYIERIPETITNPETGETRKRYRRVCKWCKIAGDQVIDKTELKTSYITLVPVYGLDVTIDGVRHLEGLIRNAKDAQRMLNYAKSASAEHAALVNKSPAIGTPEQFEGHEQLWDDLHTPLGKLPYNAVTIAGTLLPPPTRLQSPTPSAAWIQIEQQSIQDMQASLGIYDAALSANPNQQSGKALLSLQRQASQGTFHFSDNLGRSIKHCGRILVEMIPAYYAPRQVARIIGEDGQPSQVRLDPSQPQAIAQAQGVDGAIQSIYNLGVGKYDVVCDVGPSYATKRQESADAAMQLIQAVPQVMGVAGDVIVSQMDWPMAGKIAERIKRSLPPNVTAEEGDNAPPPELAQAQQQMQHMADQMQHMAQIIHELQDERAIKEVELQIKQFDAETKRIAATKEDPEEGPGIKDELAYTQAHATHELDERRLALEYLKAERDYKLELMKLGMDAERAEVEEESTEAEETTEAKEFADTE